jgi:hypothetical protein
LKKLNLCDTIEIMEISFYIPAHMGQTVQKLVGKHNGRFVNNLMTSFLYDDRMYVIVSFDEDVSSNDIAAFQAKIDVLMQPFV